MIMVGERVRVKSDIEIVHEDEEILIGQVGKVVLNDGWIFPIELEFDNPEIQATYEDLGKRRFEEFELQRLEDK
jgi:hypothetical protein